MNSRATLFANYLRISAETVHAEIVDVDGDSELDVVFDLKVDLPQRPVYDIRETERVRVRFSNEDAIPRIFVLRDDFPRVPHLISHEVELPRQLCLYEQPWQDESANWTPSNFLFRIRSWLEGTADGSLHKADQPLEPLLPVSPLKLVLPPLSQNRDERCWVQRFDVSGRVRSNERVTIVCSEESLHKDPDSVLLPVLFVRMPVCQHGVINRSPETLGELEKI